MLSAEEWSAGGETDAADAVETAELVAERDELSAVLVGGTDAPGLDLAAIGRMFTRITEAMTRYRCGDRRIPREYYGCGVKSSATPLIQ